MKELTIAIFSILVLTGGVVWWSHTREVVTLGPSSSAGIVQESKPPQPVLRPKVPPKRRPAAPVQTSSDPQPAPPSMPPPPLREKIAPPPRPFPTADQIHAGLDEDAIVDRYGEPAASMIASHKDHVVEGFVYTRDRGEVQILIRIEDGKVSSASSDSEPRFVTTPVPAIRLRN